MRGGGLSPPLLPVHPLWDLGESRVTADPEA